MTDKEKVIISKFTSLVLRHRPERAGITLDPNGWADVSALIYAIKDKNIYASITIEDLNEIARTSDKQRFAFNEDYTKIRAVHGHSVKIDLALPAVKPPDILYHGTAAGSLDGIMTNGIQSKKRLYVHLSVKLETALDVGKRRKGGPVVLEIDADRMYKDGYKFYMSSKDVWLTDAVPAAYIRQPIMYCKRKRRCSQE